MYRINDIAKLLTEDPDVFVEAGEAVKSSPKVKPASKAKRALKQKPKESDVKSKENPKAKGNKPTEEAFGKEFRALLGLEDKPEPADPSKKDRNQKSSNNELDGAKQSGKPYLEWQVGKDRCRDCRTSLGSSDNEGLCSKCKEKETGESQE